MQFTIYETGTITMAGSLHKYFNAGAHNYNDFDTDAITAVLKDLYEKFNITPQQCILKSLEIGVNIIPPIGTNVILDNCFLHLKNPFENHLNSDEGKYKQVKRSQYIIKLYNKALHYKKRGFEINNEILRFEIKYTKMQKLNKLGIFNLAELMDYGLHNFKTELLKEWDRILFFDPSIQSKSKLVLKYRNPLYWTGLIEDTSSANFHKHRNKLKKLTVETSDHVQKVTAEVMSRKIDVLTDKGVSFDPLTIRSIHTPLPTLKIELKNTICPLTGINISMQKGGSIVLSHTGLKYYYKNDPKVFEKVKRRYLSSRWQEAKFQVQIKELAHNIRTAKKNILIKQSRIYHISQLNLLQNFMLTEGEHLKILYRPLDISN